MAGGGFASLLEELSSLASGESLFACDQPAARLYASGGDGSFRGTAVQLGLPQGLSSSATAESSEEDETDSFTVGANDFGLLLGGSHGATAEAALPPEHMPPDIGQSLPDLASELLQAQSSQHMEVAHKESILKELNVELQKERHRVQSRERDVYGASKSICLAQDQVAQMGLECETLEKNISELVHETQGLREGLKETSRKTKEEGRLARKCRGRMDRHRARAEEVEQSCPVQQELEAVRMTIDDLKDRRGSYMQGDGLLILSGERQRQLQEQITATDIVKVTHTQENGELQKQVQAGRQHIQQLKREVEVAKKRHQAQLTRLHRQVQEAQARRRQWGEEADRLRASITQLRHRIKE